jgi:hypothetical protein
VSLLKVGQLTVDVADYLESRGSGYPEKSFGSATSFWFCHRFLSSFFTASLAESTP